MIERMSNNISIKPISELLGMNFFIPSYQRGYRWTEQQVKDLLSDIEDFKPSNEEWYCLQPLVVKEMTEGEKDKHALKSEKDNNKWYEVIDGQQRLTTIFLIIHYFNEMRAGKQKINESIINYETRTNSYEFLRRMAVGSDGEVNIDDTNIDYWHISIAYASIHKWMVEKKPAKPDQLVFKNKFQKSTKVIWYKTSTNDDSIDIFTRINSGKIPLTNAELIKALFLNSSNFAKADNEKLRLKQLEIASEWDRMEYALQDDSFWYFINKNENHLPTRIEFIFNLMYDTSNKEFGNDEYSTFRYFSEKFKSKSENEIEENWREIKKYFQTLEEWYSDRELYHKIGYLITIGTKIKNILDKKKGVLKTEFVKWINEQISEAITYKKQVDELEYGQDNGQLIKVLLLHNVMTTLNSEDTSLRFPFNKYKDKKKGGWSLEHIHAQNSEDIAKSDDFKEWLKAIDENELTEEIKEKIKELKENEERNNIPQLVEDISKLFGEIEIHSIENLALLSKNDNSKLNNGLFPVKRERIIDIEKKGGFIPIATKKVFQKYYNGCTKQLSKWEENDRNAYLNDIKDTLKNYLPQTELAENEE